MKFVVVTLLALVVIDPTKIARSNTAKNERGKPTWGHYKKEQHLSVPLRFFGCKRRRGKDQPCELILSVKDTANAMSTYQSLTASGRDISFEGPSTKGIMLHQQGKFEEALTNFKEAIRADNDNVDAKYNYEALKRKLEEEKKKQEEKDKNRPKEPSAYAKRLKAQADKLAADFKFTEAEMLMSDGAKKDPSVLYYEDFLNRLKEIVTIEKQK